jgi:purine-nucleoside/S-methyl-5'-thioadenosine phosphorylase / adenosine deaminase
MGWIKSKILSSVPGLVHGFGDRSIGSDPEGIAGYFGFSGIARLNQVHGSDVFLLKDNTLHGKRLADADAIVTVLRHTGIGVASADCVPILLADREGHIAAAVHAGWRGTLSRILNAVVEKIDEEYGFEAAHLNAAIGPSIKKCCYEVGDDVASLFMDGFKDWQEYLVPTDNYKYLLDLPGANRNALEKAGVQNIEVIDICTKCNPEYYSYRREGKGVGSQLSVIGFI